MRTLILTILCIAAITSGSIHAGLVAYWPLDEGSGQTVADASGNNLDGILGETSTVEASDPTWVNDAEKGYVLEWVGDSGDDEWVELSGNLDSFRNLEQGTISAWVKLPGADSVDIILAASDTSDASSEIRLFYDPTYASIPGLRFDIREGAADQYFQLSTYPTDPADNNWHHVAVTVDINGQVVLYIDGQADQSGTEVGFFDAVSNLDGMWLGKNVDSGGNQWIFKGRMSQVAVFDSVLATEMINLIYSGTDVVEIDNYANNPAPANNSDDEEIRHTLTWQCGASAPTYTVYFDTDSSFPSGPVVTGSHLATYYPPLLDYSTTYYWRVDVTDSEQNTFAGPLWSFTTTIPGIVFEQIDLFTNGTEGYTCFRIPAILVAPNGDVLAFCEGRKNDCGDDGDIDIVMKRSTDNGQTWSPLQLIYEEGGSALITIGNPCPVVDETNNRIWMPFCRNNGRVFVGYSDDNGYTWSARREVTDDVKDSSWSWYATGPGVGIQLQTGSYAGRLIIPSDHNSGVRGSHMMYSDDHGANWTYGLPMVPGCNECQAVELYDSTVLNNARSYDTDPDHRAIASSTDGGHTWSEIWFDQALPEPTCQASFLRLTHADRQDINRVIFSNPAHISSRVNMTVKLSYDEAATWPVAKQIYSGSSAYSCLTVLPDWNMGCLYERDSYSIITLARFSLAWLTDGADYINFCPTQLPGDLNQDCVVNLEDLSIMAENWLR